MGRGNHKSLHSDENKQACNASQGAWVHSELEKHQRQTSYQAGQAPGSAASCPVLLSALDELRGRLPGPAAGRTHSAARLEACARRLQTEGETLTLNGWGTSCLRVSAALLLGGQQGLPREPDCNPPAPGSLQLGAQPGCTAPSLSPASWSAHRGCREEDAHPAFSQ